VAGSDPRREDHVPGRGDEEGGAEEAECHVDPGLIASNFGRSHDPDWCRNLRASGEATVADGGGAERAYSCEEVGGAARDRWFALADEINPGYPADRERAGRTIPVFELTPR
jgi:deazaflavin-dependent oxidoreductase (nitroreductase family)